MSSPFRTRAQSLLGNFRQLGRGMTRCLHKDSEVRVLQFGERVGTMLLLVFRVSSARLAWLLPLHTPAPRTVVTEKPTRSAALATL